MSKELPYFRFYVNEWLNDDISFTDYSVKGVFVDVCSMYWFRDCSITKAMLEQRIQGAKDELKQLYDMGIIKLHDGGRIEIKFLDEQFDKLSEKRQKRVEAGRKGGLARASNAKAKVKQSSSYKDKDKDKEKDRDNGTASDEYDIPTKNDVEEYFSDSDMIPEDVPLEAEKFINHYEDEDWTKNNGKRIKNWRRQAGTWKANYKKYNRKRLKEYEDRKNGRVTGVANASAYNNEL